MACRSNDKNHKLKVISKFFLKIITFQVSFFTFLLLSYSLSCSSEIIGPEVKLKNNEIFVTTALSLDEKKLQELSNGITKELNFHIDIFRVWEMWPDEFVIGKNFIRTLQSDPVKMEYIATSKDENSQIKKRFRSFESMIQWALKISDLKLANLRELESGQYFVRVTVESKVRKLPPVIGYFMIFLPENEFRITKDSSFIKVGPAK